MNIQAREKKVGTRTDGDTTDDLPIELKVIHKGLAMYVPEGSGEKQEENK